MGLCSMEFAGSDVVRFPSAYNGNEPSLNYVLAIIQKYFFSKRTT